MLKPKIVSLTLASVSAILSLLCALSLIIAPDFTLNFFGNIFHGIDITKMAKTITFGNVIIGLIAIIIISLITGWLFAVIYNYLETKIK